MDFVAVMDILMDADLGLVFSGWIETLEYSGLTRRDRLDCLMQDDLLSVLDPGEEWSRAYLKFLAEEKDKDLWSW
jgi:hypothetical protein